MLKEAIYHKLKSDYSYLLDKNTLVIKLRAKKDDLEEVILHYGDRFEPHNPIHTKKVSMVKKYTDELFDYYECDLYIDLPAISYYFELLDTDKSIYYFDIGFRENILEDRNTYFCLPYVLEDDILQVPEWAKGAIFYQIFPDRFHIKQDERMSKYKLESWGAPPKNQYQFYGGNIEGLIDKILYFIELGIDCIYLTPIFKSSTNHRYNITDYYDIDEMFGTKEKFKELVMKLHDNNIKIVLDAVFNHSSTDFFAFKDVKEKGIESEYSEWFTLYDQHIDMSIPNYATFATVPEMPKLNTKNESLKHYLIDVATYWIKEFDIDGWRLDVANEVDHDFWRTFRKAVKSVKMDTLIIGEIWHNASEWLKGDQYDSVMNYHYYNIVKEFFALRNISIAEFDGQVNHLIANHKKQVNQVMWNLIDSHDVPRFLHIAGEKKERLKLATLYQFMTLGSPMIYYGDELGLSGSEDPDNRRTIDWNKGLDYDLLEHYKKLITIRKHEKSIRYGDYKTVLVDDKKGLYGFERVYNGDKLCIIINTSNQPQQVEYNIQNRDAILDLYSNKLYNVKDSKILVELDKYSGVILK